MKKNLFVFAFASLFVVGTTFGQSKNSTDSNTKSSQSSSSTTSEGKTTPPSASTDDHSVEKKAKDATDKMTAELNLTADQQQKALQTNMKYYKNLETMRGNADESDKAAAQSKKDMFNKERKDEFQTYLTPEQMTKLENKINHESKNSSADNADKKEKSDSMTDEQKAQKQAKKDAKSAGE